MAAKEARTGDDDIPGYGKRRTDPVAAAHSRRERAGKEEHCRVHAESMHRTDPAFGT
jgi:hypothetical protein